MSEIVLGQRVRVFVGYDSAGLSIYRYGTLLKLPDKKWSKPGEVEYMGGRREWVDHSAISAVPEE